MYNLTLYCTYQNILLILKQHRIANIFKLDFISATLIKILLKLDPLLL